MIITVQPAVECQRLTSRLAIPGMVDNGKVPGHSDWDSCSVSLAAWPQWPCSALPVQAMLVRKLSLFCSNITLAIYPCFFCLIISLFFCPLVL